MLLPFSVSTNLLLTHSIPLSFIHHPSTWSVNVIRLFILPVSTFASRNTFYNLHRIYASFSVDVVLLEPSQILYADTTTKDPIVAPPLTCHLCLKVDIWQTYCTSIPIKSPSFSHSDSSSSYRPWRRRFTKK